MRKTAKLAPLRCLNCSKAFIPLYREIKVDVSSKLLKVKDVINSLYRLNYLDISISQYQGEEEDDDDGYSGSAFVCANCADNLGALYRNWVMFNNLRSLDSNLSKQLKEMDRLLESIQQQKQQQQQSSSMNMTDDSSQVLNTMIPDVMPKIEINVDPIEMKYNPEEEEEKSNFCDVNLSHNQNEKSIYNFEVDHADEDKDDNDEFIISTDPLNLNFTDSSQNIDNHGPPTLYQCSNNDNNNFNNHNNNTLAETKNSHKKKEKWTKAEPDPNIRIVCDVCQKIFTSEKGFQIHEATHKNKAPVVCSFCDESFIELFMLYSHHRIHGVLTPFNCPYCPNSFSTKEELQDHLRDKQLNSSSFENKFQVFLCTVCGWSFRTNAELSKHTADHCTKFERCVHSKKFICAICQKVCKGDESEWLCHIGTHGEYKCSTCQKCFSGHANYVDHKTQRLVNLSAAKLEDPSFGSSLTCRFPGCSAQFCFFNFLKKHENEAHPDKPFACTTCEKRFAIEFDLKGHQKVCIVKEQSRCPLPNCDQKDSIFETLADLREHLIQSHIVVVEDDGASHKCRIRCPLCSQTFMSMVHLNMHLLGHTGELKKRNHDRRNPRSKGRPKWSQNCDRCGKTFSTIGLLRSHMMCHRDDGLDPKCPKCDRIFVSELGLRNHQQMDHKELLLSDDGAFSNKNITKMEET